MIGAEYPTITYGLRGMAYMELRVYGPSKDLHSGLFGGTVHNPAQALTELVAGMHDKNGRITLPGFYKKVRKLSESEHKAFKRLPTDKKFYLEQTGAPPLSASVRVPRWRSTACFRVGRSRGARPFCPPTPWQKFPAASSPTRLLKRRSNRCGLI
jgi:acetylornithine deacetylase/succinyl-diaminopimelate desuccinylase-like protein